MYTQGIIYTLWILLTLGHTNIYTAYVMNTMRVKMVKNIRIHDHAYEHLAKHVVYPESMADTLDRLLGLKAKDKDSRK
jgi:hypothetical protein